MFRSRTRGGTDFFVGVNLPWLHYGGDFGASAWHPRGGLRQPERREKLRAVFSDLGERGLRTIRWFLLGDGRAGLRVAEDGTPLGPDGHLVGDVEAALSLAEEHRLRILFTLIDFLWFSPAQVLNAVQMGGRRDMVADRGKRRALLDRVFLPLFERFGREPALWAWDVINEPEWATLGLGSPEPAGAVERSAMVDFIRSAVEGVHGLTAQEATVGLASSRGLPLVEGLGADFYQIHWYDKGQENPGLDAVSPSSLGVDRPLLLGEFPTSGSRLSPVEILESARRNGFAGALAWSVLGNDEASDYESAAASLSLEAGPRFAAHPFSASRQGS
jgi:hypothetical protein